MILEEIVAHTRLELEDRKRRLPPAEMRRRAESAPPTRDFAGALRGENVALIAEIKRASPSRGEIRAQAEPLRRARLYAENGASAISVLTDRRYFHGDPEDLKAARAGSHAPLLRKDFVVDEYQVYESRALRADALLLIVRILDDGQLRDYRALAEALGMGALVEVHDEAELERALASGAPVVGINNRNLADFSADLSTTLRLAPRIPPDALVVSESGIFTHEDVVHVAGAQVDAVLVGEALMRAQDVGAAARELANVPKAH